jgi:acyl-CoA thioesterase
MHPFDQAIALEAIADDALRGHISELYWNFVSPYGGVTAAVLLNSMLLSAERIGDPLTLTVNFAGPIRAGAFTVARRVLRATRTTQHWAVQLTQGEDPQPLTSAVSVFAARRPTWNLTEAAPPDVGPADDSGQATPFPKLRWPAMYQMRYVRGRAMRENPDSLTYSWIRDAQPRVLDYASLTAMCDAFFPRIFLRRPQLVPIGTVSLNIYFHADAQTLAEQGTDALLAVARANVFSQGYFDQEGQIWGRGGRLLATTHQVVWYKE